MPTHKQLDGGTTADVPPQLDQFIEVIEESANADGIVGVMEIADQLHMPEAKVLDWAKQNILIAWPSAKGGLNVPKGQIRPGSTPPVVSHLQDVVDAVGDAELAWSFLTQEWPFKDKVVQPLKLMDQGRYDEVVFAAKGFGATFT